MDVKGQTSPFLMDSVINFRCDKGFFPAGDMSSICDSVGGVGIWRPDTNIICRDIPGEHAVNYIYSVHHNYSYVAFHHSQLLSTQGTIQRHYSEL